MRVGGALALLALLAAMLVLPGQGLGGDLPWAAPPFLAGVALAALAAERAGRRGWLALGGVAALAGAAYALSFSPLAAALALGGYGAALLGAARAAWGRARWLALPLVAAGGALLPALLWQLESNFADEEFQVALVALVMGGSLALLHLLLTLVSPPRAARPTAGWRALALLALALPGALGLVAFLRYPASAYGATAAPFEGISAEAPFLCAELPPEEWGAAGPDGAALFAAQVAGVAAREEESAADLGWLAVATGEGEWAARFRAALFDEAAAGRFTEPANSIKYFQYEAAQRAHYYDAARARFPELFSADDQRALAAWFAGINRRAMTVEWVDLLYGSAFGAWQPGPYANQEIGNGLIATLRATGLEAPELREANARYLAPGRTGWRWRWRVSDDTYEYQRVWSDSAFLQSADHGAASDDPDYALRRALSFEWQLLQMLPDGSAPAYNNPGGTHPPYGSLLLGAALTGDGRFLSGAARMLDFYEATGQPLYSQPGFLAAPDVVAEPLTTGSCLLYGESGLPARGGPLAPDKIVLRDGWDADDQYLLLNLRFAGWHRYKGTNSVSVIAAGGETLLSDVPTGAPWAWVPAGRQKFRDKRIARSQTNGLLVPARGLGGALHALTGLGEAWAQDVPPYAGVRRFTTLPGWDSSATTIEGWHGWSHERAIHFLHGGPIVILDRAMGGEGRPALSWNSEVPMEEDGEGQWTLGGARLRSIPLLPASTEQHGQQLVLRGEQSGALAHVTLFLPEAWAEARVESAADERGLALEIEGDGETMTLWLNLHAGQEVTLGGITSDAEALLIRDGELCSIGGTRAEVGGVSFTLPAGEGCQPLR